MHSSGQRIVVLDGFTLNPGDLSWESLESIGECVVYDRTPPHETIGRSQSAHILLTNKTIITGEAIDTLGSLRYIGVMATGYNVVDLDAAAQRNIPVTNVPEYGTASVTNMVFAHIFELTRQVAHHAKTVRDGKWAANADFCYWDTPLVELDGLTMGIVGFGRIGRSVAKSAQAFGMKVMAYDPHVSASQDSTVRFTGLDTVFRSADIVSLHCPLTGDTRHLVDSRRIGLMKKTAYLINTGRGPLVCEEDLAAALDEGRIAGAGLDVLGVEPPRTDNPLVRARNCFITPHIAWATHAARSRLMNIVVGNVRAFLDGAPVNVVNGV